MTFWERRPPIVNRINESIQSLVGSQNARLNLVQTNIRNLIQLQANFKEIFDERFSLDIGERLPIEWRFSYDLVKFDELDHYVLKFTLEDVNANLGILLRFKVSFLLDPEMNENSLYVEANSVIVQAIQTLKQKLGTKQLSIEDFEYETKEPIELFSEPFAWVKKKFSRKRSELYLIKEQRDPELLRGMRVFFFESENKFYIPLTEKSVISIFKDS